MCPSENESTRVDKWTILPGGDRGTHAEYRETDDRYYPHALRVCMTKSQRVIPSAEDGALYFATSELTNIPIIKALIEILRLFEKGDVWGQTLGYSVCNMCGVKATAGERFVHADGCPYEVLAAFEEK